MSVWLRKKEYFKKLVEIGFKEIEVAFRWRLRSTFDFTRFAIETAPDDASIQVLSPCRERLIKHGGVPPWSQKARHVPLPICFREVMIWISKQRAEGTRRQVRHFGEKLSKDDPTQQQTVWDFEFSPETFSDTDPDYALEV